LDEQFFVHDWLPPEEKSDFNTSKMANLRLFYAITIPFMDIPISSPAIPSGNKTIAKIEMAKVPLFGILYKTGSVLVNRKSDQSRKEVMGK
jgi:hypothetical protein